MIILDLHGTWFEMGRQYGTALKEEIRRVLEFSRRRSTPESDYFLLPDGVHTGMDFLDQLFQGVMEGSGLTEAEMLSVNGVEVAYADELLAKFGVGAVGQCSALALNGPMTSDGSMIFGRNYDWLASFANLDMVIAKFHPSDADMTFSVINFPGCLYLVNGMNSRGLFVEINTAIFASEERAPEHLHNVWKVWQVLLNAGNVSEAIEILDTLSARANFIIGLADADEAVSYEWGVRASAVMRNDHGILAMSNHFVQPGWVNTPAASAGGIISSVSRRQALLNQAADIVPGTANVERMKQILAVTVENGGAKWDGTVLQIIALPSLKILLLRAEGEKEWLEYYA